ncbi:DUF6602 domain-containing protein [Pelagibius sp. Alg239-R121]|uniref:DUF6602 domain-containing protein n=1 Tax=Pelagibius sp. Alg239-R121 TaxID=2993448 RepID=UPI0024A6D0A2|nr:DUF6602 domain-containing protein [Pelagibius sp. Alg239-R121]
MSTPKTYKTAGWQRFELNRRKMLASYDLAKFENRNRPLITEHGNVAESALRSWLSDFLPDRYGVTSGFILPPVLEEEHPIEYHYDLIIYDKLNAPVLVSDQDTDRSRTGTPKMIPAQCVMAVFEVKARATPASANDAAKKLQELSSITSFLRKGFFSGVVFFELETLPKKSLRILENLIPNGAPTRMLNTGCILRCTPHQEASGKLESFQGVVNGSPLKGPLFKNFLEDEITVVDGQPAAPNETSFGILDIRKTANINQQHFFLRHISRAAKGEQGNYRGVDVEWSRNGFALFILDVLSRLGTGRRFSKDVVGGYPFGLEFDRVIEP